MKKLLRILVIILLGIAAFVFVKQKHVVAPTTDDVGLGIANPASVKCVEDGGSLQIVQDSEGNEYGMCTLPDGTECEERDYYQGICGPKTKEQTTIDTGKGEPIACTMDAKECPDGSYVGRIAPDCEFAPCPDEEK